MEDNQDITANIKNIYTDIANIKYVMKGFILWYYKNYIFINRK